MPWRDAKAVAIGGKQITGARIKTLPVPGKTSEVVTRLELPSGITPAGVGAEVAIEGTVAEIRGFEKVGDRYALSLTDPKTHAFPEVPVPVEEPAEPVAEGQVTPETPAATETEEHAQ